MTLIWSRYEEPLLYGSFPEGFLWGTATAAYQVCQGEEEDIYSFSLSLHFDQISNFCFHHNLKEGGANKEIIIWATFTFGHFYFCNNRWKEEPTRGGRERASGTLSPLSRGTSMMDRQERFSFEMIWIILHLSQY